MLVATGQTEYYPLYASIGTVHNNVQRAHRNAFSIIGFLAILKSEFVSTIFQTCAHLYVIQRIGSTKMVPSSASSDGSSFISAELFTDWARTLLTTLSKL